MKTSVYIGTSLDGFIAKTDGNIDWLTQYANDDAIHAYEEFMNGIDAIVIGRGTFEKILTFPSWPYIKKAFVLSTAIKQLPDTIRDKATLLSLKPIFSTSQSFSGFAEYRALPGVRIADDPAAFKRATRDILLYGKKSERHCDDVRNLTWENVLRDYPASIWSRVF